MEALGGWMLLAWLYRKWKEWDARRTPKLPPEPPTLTEDEYSRLYAAEEARRRRAEAAADAPVIGSHPLSEGPTA